MKLRMIVEAYCPTKEDFNELLERIKEEAHYHFDEIKTIDIELGDMSATFYCIGTAKEDFNEDSFIKLTHHAEMLYEDSNIQHTHVEVAIDDKWYGR